MKDEIERSSEILMQLGNEEKIWIPDCGYKVRVSEEEEEYYFSCPACGVFNFVDSTDWVADEYNAVVCNNCCHEQLY